MKDICFIVLLSFALCGCVKNEGFHSMSCSKNPQKEILGKWQVVSRYAPGWEFDGFPGTEIHEFKDNNIVVISFDSDVIHVPPTEFSYHFADDPSGFGGLGVVINGEYYDCCISKNLMSLHSSTFCEGTVLHLHFKKL